jgi:transcriptional regulator with XRE-family HTH domain
MSFHDLHQRLVRHLNRRVRTGELSERGVAKRAGISQPHVHNVLKGSRLLSWQSADALLRELQLDVLDLLDDDEN